MLVQVAAAVAATAAAAANIHCAGLKVRTVLAGDSISPTNRRTDGRQPNSLHGAS